MGFAGERERLWAGQHSFPFHYTLPAKLPASFHGRLGYVRYFCEATLERNALPNIQCRTMFSVSNIADVNTDPKADVSYIKLHFGIGYDTHHSKQSDLLMLELFQCKVSSATILI